MMAVMPQPGECSELFASGWRAAQSHLDAGFSHDVDGPRFGHEEKFNGYIERMATERRARAGEVAKPVWMRQVSEVAYTGEGDVTLEREYGRTPNGNQLGGAWVLRRGGQWVDFDIHRYDVAERHDLNLENDECPAQACMAAA